MNELPEDVAAALRVERARSGVDDATRARLRARVKAAIVPAPPAPVPKGMLRPGLGPAIGFVVGAGTVGLAMWLRPAPPPVESPKIIEVPAIASSVAPVVATPPLVSAPPLASSAPKASMPPAPSASSLVAERALLDIAHSALSNGDSAGALAALSQHASRYPRGVYREEREALAVQALRAAGRTEEAARRAAAFKTRYPRSLFLSTVEGPGSANP